MTTIQLKINKYAVSPISISVGTEKSYGFEKLSFGFSSEWNGLFKTVTFYPKRRQAVSIEGIEGGVEYDLPAEVTERAGYVLYVVSGYAGNNDVNPPVVEKRIYSVEGAIEVLSSNDELGVAPNAPTPSEIEQIREYARQAKEAAESAASGGGDATFIGYTMFVPDYGELPNEGELDVTETITYKPEFSEAAISAFKPMFFAEQKHGMPDANGYTFHNYYTVWNFFENSIDIYFHSYTPDGSRKKIRLHYQYADTKATEPQSITAYLTTEVVGDVTEEYVNEAIRSAILDSWEAERIASFTYSSVTSPTTSVVRYAVMLCGSVAFVSAY